MFEMESFEIWYMISCFVLYLLGHAVGRWENYQGKSFNRAKGWWSLDRFLL